MAPNKIILLACGSFNPPTNMHLRMFEIAKDNLNRFGQYLVVGGIISPVHDAYGKKELVPSIYRCEMIRLALRSSSWINISEWECSQETWCRTRQVLQHHQNVLNSVLNSQKDSPNNNQIIDNENGYNYCNWITNDIKNLPGPVQIKFLCGADLLESFATPGLWSEEDIETIIGHHGIVVITREGSNPLRFIYESDILTKYQYNIIIVTEWITNDVSSTKVRRALGRQESVKYLMEDSVIEFIKKHGLYGTKNGDFKYEGNLNKNLNVPVNTYFLTPSPSDINMMSLSSSSNDIILNLNPLTNENLTTSDFARQDSNFQTFQSTAQIKFSTNKEKYGDEGSKCPVEEFATPGKSPGSPEKKKKVGFSETKNVDDNTETRKQGSSGSGADKAVADGAPTVRIYRKLSEKCSKSSGGKKMTKAESEKNDSEPGKENLLLRRSQSDAVMSRKNENGETVSVKIQFTKDGIKVISDKESIV